MIFRTIRLYCTQSRVYWLLWTLVQNITHWRRKKGLGVRQRVRNQRIFFTVFRTILRRSIKAFLVAVGVAIILQLVDSFFAKQFSLSVPEDSDYVTFLGTVSSIGAVFIGLYYAGISAVGSAIYAKVPNNVRDLLAEEQFGNVYMRFLSFLTVLCLSFISLRVLDFPRNSLAVPIVAILAGFGVIAFVQLGRIAFYFFDPTKLSASIFERLHQRLRMVRVRGFQWNLKAFQKNAHHQALMSLDTLLTLADITAKEPHLSGKPFIELTRKLVNFLRLYEQFKKMIPTNSLWYEEQYQHRDWYLSDYSEVLIAHQTGTFIRPTTTTNKQWVEDRVIPNLLKCVTVNLENQKYTELLDLFEDLEHYVSDLSRNAEVERAIEFLQGVSRIVLDQILLSGNKTVVLDEDLEKIAVVERISALPISAILGFNEGLMDLRKTKLEKRVKSINWASPMAIYKKAFPTHCLEQLEWIRDRLAFEFEIEGRVVTPSWYQSELVRLTIAQRFVSETDFLIKSSGTLFNEMIKKAQESKHVWLAAAIMSRKWEFWSKLNDQVQAWENHWNRLTNERKLKELSWPSFEIDSIKNDIDNRFQQLIQLMSKQIVVLESKPRPNGFPDYAGQFLHTSGEVVFEALLDNSEDLLSGVFEPYLIGCLSRFEHLRPIDSVVDWRVTQQMKLAVAILLDALDVCGYAKLLADYHENEELWHLIKTTWDKYLVPESDWLPLFKAAVRITDSAFEIPHRGVLRTSWSQRVLKKLQDVPRHNEFNTDGMFSYTVVDHESELVRIFAKDHLHRVYDGIDVFVEFYLDKIKGDIELDFGPRRRRLRDSLMRERQRDSSHGGVSEPD